MPQEIHEIIYREHTRDEVVLWQQNWVAKRAGGSGGISQEKATVMDM